MSRYKSQLKTVNSQYRADNYVRDGSMVLTGSSDMFLYTHVNRVRKPEPERSGGGSGTHTSSSGSSHGGGGGKF